MVDTTSFESYKASVLDEIQKQLQIFYCDTQKITVEQILEDQSTINAYPNLAKLTDIKEDQIIILEEDIDTTYAEMAVLNGEFFWEHAAAGEATRLGIGTKYVIDLSTFSLERIKKMILDEVSSETRNEIDAETKIAQAKEIFTTEYLLSECGGNPHNLMPLTLGQRHMIQMVYDVRKIAKKHGADPDLAVHKQKTLLILNTNTAEDIQKEFSAHNYYGLDPKNAYFMIQQPFNGIAIENGELRFATGDNLRLHNHGQMMMQKAHSKSIFRFINGKKEYLQDGEFEKVLSGCKDLLSYNIEDISYLTQAIDLPSLALALNLGKRGYDMVMEIVAQNPYKPQKGGAAFYDPIIRKNVMIESNRLKGIRNEDIRHLNKNFNHYPNPSSSFQKMKERGLALPFEVKKAKDGKMYIYPCPVQGDLNFLVKTAFVMRKNLLPINNWKSARTTPPAIHAFFHQERQDGWKAFAESITSS